LVYLGTRGQCVPRSVFAPENTQDLQTYILSPNGHRAPVSNIETAQTVRASNIETAQTVRASNIETAQTVRASNCAMDVTCRMVSKGKVHPCAGTEALYRPYDP